MKRILLFFFLVSLYIPSNAKEYTISLSGQKLNNSISGYYINAVILGQREDSCLGYLIGGSEVLNYNPIFFEKNIRDEVKVFLANSLPKKDGLSPLIIRVNRLFLYPLSRQSGTGYHLELSISFIFPADQGFKEDFTSSTSLFMSLGDVHKNLAEIIAGAFDKSICQYQERKGRGLLNPVVITKEQMNTNSRQYPANYKCRSSELHRAGIYRTWFDFRDDTPDTAHFYTIIYHNDKKQPELSSAKLKFVKDSSHITCWGFSDGTNVFINTGSQFALLTPEEDHWTAWFKHSENNTPMVIPVYAGGGLLVGILAGALAGGAIAILFSSGSEAGSNNVSSYSSSSGDPEIYKLDMLSGMLVPYYLRDYTRIASNVVFFVSKISVANATLSVFVDNQLQCQLKPGNYFTLQASCHHPFALIKLVSSTGGEFVEEIPMELVKPDVYLLKVKRNHTIDMDHPFGEVKNDLLKFRTNENTVCRVEL
jgi:hypothetical protein